MLNRTFSRGSDCSTPSAGCGLQKNKRDDGRQSSRAAVRRAHKGGSATRRRWRDAAPPVQSECATGDARYLLDLAVGSPTFGSLQVLRASVSNLNPRPAPEGDIPRPTGEVGVATKRILIGMVDEMGRNSGADSVAD
jgi:hypothetical protein